MLHFANISSSCRPCCFGFFCVFTQTTPQTWGDTEAMTKTVPPQALSRRFSGTLCGPQTLIGWFASCCQTLATRNVFPSLTLAAVCVGSRRREKDEVVEWRRDEGSVSAWNKHFLPASLLKVFPSFSANASAHVGKRKVGERSVISSRRLNIHICAFCQGLTLELEL